MTSSIDLITIALLAIDDLNDWYEERVDLTGMERASVARAALGDLLTSAQREHERRYSASS